MLFAHKKKGITPIIAVILLLMMTVAAAGAAFYWFVKMQGQLQGGTESYSENLASKMSSKVEVVSVDYSASSSILTMFLQNQGNEVVSIKKSTTPPTTTLMLKDSSLNIVCATDLASGGDAVCTTGCTSDLEVGELQEIQITFSGDCDDINSLANNTMLYFTLDFGGQASTGGQFLRN